MNKNSKWSKFFDILGIISAILDMVLKSYREEWCCPLNDFVIFTFKKKGGDFFFQLLFSNLGVSNMDLPVVVNIMVFYEKYWWTIMLLYIFSPSKHVGNTKHIYISIVFFCYARFWCAKLVCYIYYIFIFQIVDSVKPKMVNK